MYDIFHQTDKLVIRPINKNGLVTSGNVSVYFVEFREPDNIIITLDNPDKKRYFVINFHDVLQAYDFITNKLIYTYDVNRALWVVERYIKVIFI